jgi:metal-sulfur cluster biosynthetic enzyme
MKEYVGDLEGVKNVHTKMVFDPPWSPEMMTEDAKFALGF